jgi:hypothetical protein
MHATSVKSIPHCNKPDTGDLAPRNYSFGVILVAVLPFEQ